MKKLKIMTVVGTRPEIIRLSRVIALIDLHCDQVLVHTGQNYDYDLNGVFFDQLGIRKPDIFLDAAGKNAAHTIGQVIIATDNVIEKHIPDAMLILGDTNSCLSAISAKRRKVPIFHMEAGNRCFDYTVPEEINRKIVDHIADINLTYSEIAKNYLIREGVPADQIIKTGSPMHEVLDYYKDSIETSAVIDRLNLIKRNYFVVSAHREENVDSPQRLTKLIDLLNSLAERYNLPVIVSTHPRTRIRLAELNMTPDNRVQFLQPFGFADYINLQMNAKCVLSDSGTITEESSILNFPALNLREVHERPEGFEEGSVMFVGMNKERVFQGLSILESQPRGSERLLNIVGDYKPSNVSSKVLRIIQSYTDFVNRKTWNKSN